ncbi:3-coathanger stack domain-containing protein [Ferruginibacter sp. SUN106]|uniref:WD40/YVTN/BNR-like repeat-containing protein n=1 Tax=Ferruginibacter sp. SUN106 TaxID=2978348 RepID=UPI003D35EC4B
MKKKIVTTICFIVAFMCCMAQQTISPELKTALNNKSGFEEVVKTITDYYVQKDYATDKKLYSQFKKWNRWAWYMGIHLDDQGHAVNISEKTWEAVHQNSVQRNPGNFNTPNSPASNSGYWSPVGPFSVSSGVGRVDRLAFDPVNPNIIYAGTPAGGLWRTLDGGANWGALNGYLPNIGVSGIVVDRDNVNTLYVLTGDGDSNINGFVETFGYIRPSIGVLKSTDGGISWSKLSNIVVPGTTFYGFKLVQSQDFHNRFFACTSDGLYRSTDYGVTWTRDATIGITSVYDVELGPPSYVYACTASRVYISTNFGNPFVAVPNTAFSSVPVSSGRAALAVTANIPNRLYVSFGVDAVHSLLYRSDNNGTSFTLVNAAAPPTQSYMAALAVSPANGNIVQMGEVTLQRSLTGGPAFAVVGTGIVHADVHELQYNPLNNLLYAACDGGVYRSTDEGGNWSSLFNGIQNSQFYHFTGVNGNNNLILGGAQDNGLIQSTNNAGGYQQVLGGDGYESAYLNGNTNAFYFSINTFLIKGTTSPPFNATKTPPGATGFYPSVAIHPANDQVIYAGFTNGIFRTDNDGATWANKGNQASVNGGPAGGLAVSANTPDRVYAASNTTLWRSDNKGDNWTTISGTPGWPGASVAMPITDICSRPNNGDEIWVTFGGYTSARKVYYSSNGGAGWSNFSGSLPNLPVYCIKYTSDGDAYIGTDIGVYFMDFAMNDWVPFYNGLPVVPVADLFVNEIDGSIRAGTFGRGIWQSDLYADCGPLLLLSGITQGNNFYQSGGNVESIQDIPGSLGNSVKYRSPVKIVLKPGFSIKNNAYLHALIGPCGQGVFKLNSSNTALSKGDYFKMNLQESILTGN